MKSLKYLSKLFGKLFCFFAILLLLGCSTVKYVPIETNTKTTTIIRDTTIIIIDTVYIEIEKEVLRDFCDWNDTLYLEDSYSEAEVKLDTITRTLQGEIRTKQQTIEKDIELTVPLTLTERNIETNKEIPIEVTKEVTVYPQILWYSIGINIILLIILIFAIIIKLKRGLLS